MTPIPPDVAAAIVAAGHSLSAAAISLPGSRSAWRWNSDGSVECPAWEVTVSDCHGREPTARAALLDALARCATDDERAAVFDSARAKRLRSEWRKAVAARDAETAAKRAAEVRALAAQVAAMWPEVGP